MPPQPSALSVSLSRHQACRACRTRKIRCDAQRPACSPCVKWAVSRGRDPEAVICSYDGDVTHTHHGAPLPPPQELPTLVLDGGDSKVLEGRVAELESMLAQQSATLAALLPSINAEAGPSALVGLPIARSAGSSSASSPDASGLGDQPMMPAGPHRSSSVASSSGSSLFTGPGAGERRRSSLDGVSFPSGPEAIAYPSLPPGMGMGIGMGTVTVTTSVPLGPHSVACSDPNCPDYLRAREAAAMRIPQPLSLPGYYPFQTQPPAPPGGQQLGNILSELGFGTGVPGQSPPQPSDLPQIKTEEPDLSAPFPPSALPHALPLPMSMPPGMHGYPISLMDPSWGMPAYSQPPLPMSMSSGSAGAGAGMDISPEVWSMLFPAPGPGSAPQGMY